MVLGVNESVAYYIMMTLSGVGLVRAPRVMKSPRLVVNLRARAPTALDVVKPSVHTIRRRWRRHDTFYGTTKEGLASQRSVFT